MVWKYVSGDQYSVEQLLKFKTFFESDLKSALHEYNKVLSYQKYGLPGWRWMEIRTKVGVEEAKQNIEIVNKALAEAKEAGRYDNS